jgi:hypothetical protein
MSVVAGLTVHVLSLYNSLYRGTDQYLLHDQKVHLDKRLDPTQIIYITYFMVTGAVCKAVQGTGLCIQLSDRLYLLLSLMFNTALTFKLTVTCQVLLYRRRRAVSYMYYHSHKTLLSKVSGYPLIFWEVC